MTPDEAARHRRGFDGLMDAAREAHSRIPDYMRVKDRVQPIGTVELIFRQP